MNSMIHILFPLRNSVTKKEESYKIDATYVSYYGVWPI